jgi:Transglutaminase-like superfamily
MRQNSDPLVGRPNIEASCYLSDHVYACGFQDGVVLLDLRAEDYMGISAEHIPELRRHVLNWPILSRAVGHPVDRDVRHESPLIEKLLARGVLTRNHAPTKQLLTLDATAALSAKRCSDLLNSIPLKVMGHFFIALLTVLCRRRGRLEHDLASLKRRLDTIGQEHACRDSVKIQNLVQSFFTLRIWFYTASRHCLFDSLVLSAFLIRQGVPCRLMIAVAIKPFLAHAWVQIDNLVLNDTAEHAQMFAPILAIEQPSRP